MTQPVKKSDTHTVAVATSSPGVPTYGVNIFSITNPATGEEVERVEGYTAALAAQKVWNAKAARNGQ